MHYTLLSKYLKAGKFPTNDNITLWEKVNLYTTPIIQTDFSIIVSSVVPSYKILFNNLFISVKLKDIISSIGCIKHDIEYLIGREDHKEFTLEANSNTLYLSKLGLIPINKCIWVQFKILDCSPDTQFLIVPYCLYNKKFNSHQYNFNGSYFLYTNGCIIPISKYQYDKNAWRYIDAKL